MDEMESRVMETQERMAQAQMALIKAAQEWERTNGKLDAELWRQITEALSTTDMHDLFMFIIPNAPAQGRVAYPAAGCSGISLRSNVV